MSRKVTAVLVALGAGALLLACSSRPPRPPEGPPPEYEPTRDWTDDGRPLPRHGAQPPASSTPAAPAPPTGATSRPDLAD